MTIQLIQASPFPLPQGYSYNPYPPIVWEDLRRSKEVARPFRDDRVLLPTSEGWFLLGQWNQCCIPSARIILIISQLTILLTPISRVTIFLSFLQTLLVSAVLWQSSVIGASNRSLCAYRNRPIVNTVRLSHHSLTLSIYATLVTLEFSILW